MCGEEVGGRSVSYVSYTMGGYGGVSGACPSFYLAARVSRRILGRTVRYCGRSRGHGMAVTTTRMRCRGCYGRAHIRRVVSFTGGVGTGGVKVTAYIKLLGRDHVLTSVLHERNFRICNINYGTKARGGASINVPRYYRNINIGVYGPVLRTGLLGGTGASLGIIIKLYIKRSDLFCGCSRTLAAATIAGSHMLKRGPITTLCATSDCCSGLGGDRRRWCFWFKHLGVRGSVAGQGVGLRLIWVFYCGGILVFSPVKKGRHADICLMK